MFTGIGSLYGTSPRMLSCFMLPQRKERGVRSDVKLTTPHICEPAAMRSTPGQIQPAIETPGNWLRHIELSLAIGVHYLDLTFLLLTHFPFFFSIFVFFIIHSSATLCCVTVSSILRSLQDFISSLKIFFPPCSIFVATCCQMLFMNTESLDL